MSDRFPADSPLGAEPLGFPEWARETPPQPVHVDQSLRDVLLYFAADDAVRKRTPLATAVFGYFPAAMIALAQHCLRNADRYGHPMHWNRTRSTGHIDAAAKHLLDLTQHPDDLDSAVSLLWRAAALTQLLLEKHGAPKASNAK